MENASSHFLSAMGKIMLRKVIPRGNLLVELNHHPFMRIDSMKTSAPNETESCQSLAAFSLA